MRTGYQRRTESQMPWFFTNVKEQQDVTSSEIGITPLADTPVNLVQDREVNQKPLRRPTELSSGYKRRTDSYDTRVQTLTVTQSKLFEKKKRTRRELNKLPIGHHWRTEKPQISSDHFVGQQDVSSSKTHIPPLVDTTNILVQKTTKGSFKEQQDASLSQTHYPPLTGTPTNLFKKKVSVKGLNKIQIRQPTRTGKPQKDEDFKKQQDVSSSETLLLPSIPTKDLQSIKGLPGHVRRTEMRELSSCNVKEQQDTSSSKISLPLISTTTSLSNNWTKSAIPLNMKLPETTVQSLPIPISINYYITYRLLRQAVRPT
ncbi:hypothetical protein Q7C36_019381 [Tachysurus vachellii]|uniref:Uncharacterized protein n=1 Tax=Tachysurus vachellii TaxID=175792 RepID=A0AA88LW84_TACVA|nr:hypothetical protein Q7C36_019381 [Tachysurus vachellii]